LVESMNARVDVVTDNGKTKLVEKRKN